MTAPDIPKSSVPGIDWPAIPDVSNSAVLAIAYQLAQSEWWEADRIEAQQLSQLSTLLSHAVQTVPLYRERLAETYTPNGEITLEQFQTLPILTRADLQDEIGRLKSEALPKSHAPISEVSTSGSTGRVVTVLGTRVTALMNAAVGLRYHQWHQRRFDQTVASIQVVKGERAETAAAGTPSAWVPGHGTGTIYYFDINENISAQADWLKGLNPAYLFTYPSVIEALLERLERSDIPALIQVSTLGEALDEGLRERVTNVWDVPLVDAYSTSEVGMLALQCPEHSHYHIQSECCLLEVLREDGAPCGVGETGRVVLTNLHNFAVPLIRYEVGDYAEVGEPCGCGRNLPVLNRIAGRVRNMLRLPNGEMKWPRYASSRLAGVAPVKQAQLIQKTINELDVRLVVARPLTTVEIESLRELIVNSLGYPFELNFVFVDAILRAANGKFEDFQSLL